MRLRSLISFFYVHSLQGGTSTRLRSDEFSLYLQLQSLHLYITFPPGTDPYFYSPTQHVQMGLNLLSPVVTILVHNSSIPSSSEHQPGGHPLTMFSLVLHSIHEQLMCYLISKDKKKIYISLLNMLIADPATISSPLIFWSYLSMIPLLSLFIYGLIFK